MTNEFLRVNGGDLIPLNTIKRIRKVTDEDRKSLSALGPQVDANRFMTRLEFADGRKSYANEAISDFHIQGVALVQVDDGAFIPSDNIIKARDLSAEDRRVISDKIGRDLREDFCASVETKAGRILVTINAAEVMRRTAHPTIET
ncbi:MAG: hypothetical protein DHS20C05_06740 [Hyphococcus sp.]|nr:MAG: hypothetical protein DHS20C05_06740 [Marinicaulis sp.]